MSRFQPNGIVTLTTDFGTTDGYVGAMKGVILTRFPEARVVDLTHMIGAQDVRGAAQALANSCPLFPEGTVHVVVVDPEVGAARAALVAEHDGQVWVAPDNGVVTEVVPETADAWRIERRDLMRDKVSRTFHGRDIFAPVAAALAAGRVAPDDVGPLHVMVRLPRPRTRRGVNRIRGEVLSVDRFGNLVSNIPLAELPESLDLSRVLVSVGAVEVGGISWTYADVEPDEWVAVISSNDTVELSVRDGNAAERCGLRVGAPVVVSWRPT